MHPTGSINQTFLDISRSAISEEPYLISSYLPLIFYLACTQVGIGPLHSFEAVLIISDKIKWNQFLVFLVAFSSVYSLNHVHD